MLIKLDKNYVNVLSGQNKKKGGLFILL